MQLSSVGFGVKMTKNDTKVLVERDWEQLHPTCHPKSHADPLVIQRGLWSRPLGNTLAFSPRLATSEAEVDEAIKRLDAATDGITL